MNYFVARLVDPVLMPLHPGERVYWMYLLSALAIAAFLVARRGGFSLARLKALLLHASALTDYRYFVVNRVVFGILMLPAAPAAALGAAAVVSGLLNNFLNPVAPLEGPGWLVLQTLLSALAMDFGLFYAHRLLHTVPLLWEFHKVHHSAEVLTPVTAYRMHPVDDLLSMGLAGAFGGIVVGTFQFLQPGNAGPAALMGLHVVVFLYYLAGFNLRHSHVWLSYGPVLERILISPAQHQIHHSTAERHYGKNLGFMFAFWDGMFGSLYIPRWRETLRFGLADDESREYHGIRQLYFLPFIRGIRAARPAAVLGLFALLLGVCAQSIAVLGIALNK
jgi:sterol desaturase/sphingolipid hydroxylase (fatty acid hydroxylase superfamily)